MRSAAWRRVQPAAGHRAPWRPSAPGRTVTRPAALATAESSSSEQPQNNGQRPPSLAERPRPPPSTAGPRRLVPRILPVPGEQKAGGGAPAHVEVAAPAGDALAPAEEDGAQRLMRLAAGAEADARQHTAGASGNSAGPSSSGMAPSERPRHPVPAPRRRAVPVFSDVDAQVSAAYDGLQVTVTGRDSPAPLASYNELAGPKARYKVAPLLLRNAAAAYRLARPTPVQAHVLPAVMEGRDVLALSVTGSGKTLSYLLPCLAQLMSGRPRPGTKNSASPDALVLVPTRELAEQVYADAQLLLRGSHLKALAVHGGVSVAEQVLAVRGRLRRSGGGVDLLVATPGRLAQLVERRVVRLGRLSCLVLDEADRLLDLGLWPDLRVLLSHKDLPTARQTVLTCAALPSEEQGGRAALEGLLRDAVCVCVGEHRLGERLDGAAASSSGGLVSPVVRQVVELIDGGRGADVDALKHARLLQLLSPVTNEGVAAGVDAAGGGPAVVFTRSLQRAEEVARQLAARGVSVALMHRDLTQDQRDEALQCFRFGVTGVLVATGLASRGLNFPDVGHVINYDVPLSLSGYVHQVGRTGRGGRPGLATTLFTPRDRPQAAAWLVDCLRSAPGGQVPAWLQRLAAEAAMKAAAEEEEGAPEPAPGSESGSGGGNGRRGDRITVRPRGPGQGVLQATQAAGSGAAGSTPRPRGWARRVLELSGDALAGGQEAAGAAAAQSSTVAEQEAASSRTHPLGELGRGIGGDSGAAADGRFGVFLPPRPGRRQGPAAAGNGGNGGPALAVGEAGPGPLAAAELLGSGAASAYAPPGSGGSGGAGLNGGVGVVDRRHDAEAWQAVFDLALQPLQPPKRQQQQAVAGEAAAGVGKGSRRRRADLEPRQEAAAGLELDSAGEERMASGVGQQGGGRGGLLFADGSVLVEARPEAGVSVESKQHRRAGRRASG
ncbi:hypothetical protein HXX76_006171 [Chlamydomonas incerta]|uniref:DEAD box RNA helicase n=1 Tax=Chlamydomonas incerta TaxID=51695 RepID=A0A835T0M6_CHLIN|nr:hypothetical protein HXX76_006171 [Chlamydomonas incerta]|eukprot:KAG2436643.1 hypothetical protein HXX76_006171 [Chlamydomonas incerta]